MTAARTEAVANEVDGGIESGPAGTVERQGELDPVGVLEIRERDADERDAVRIDQRARSGQEVSRRLQNRERLRGRLGHRLRTRRAAEVAEAQPEHHRAADATACAQPSRDPVDESEHDRCRAPPVTSGPCPARVASRSSPDVDPPGSGEDRDCARARADAGRTRDRASPRAPPPRALRPGPPSRCRGRGASRP